MYYYLCQSMLLDICVVRTQATQDLIEAAATKWREVEGDYRDDITAVVVRLPCFPE